jgi:glyoxylase-like metal-dependent hydrolase (beta-lactamase superfamily II)
VAQLACGGIDAADIDYVFISHFHADHIAGVADFPSARLIYGAEGMTYAQQMRGLRGVIKGILGDLVRGLQAMPSLPIEPIEPTHQGVPPDLAPFDQGYDLFGDGQLWAVPLPGHARGQYGLYFQASHGPVFLVADACWSSDAYQKGILPHPITRLAMDDWSSYCTTIQKLQVLWKRRPEILIIPSHCPKAWARYEGITRENFKTLPSWFSS